jgi:hypothetical protein
LRLSPGGTAKAEAGKSVHLLVVDQVAMCVAGAHGADMSAVPPANEKESSGDICKGTSLGANIPTTKPRRTTLCERVAREHVQCWKSTPRR